MERSSQAVECARWPLRRYGLLGFGTFLLGSGIVVVALANSTRSLDWLGFALIEVMVDG